jgi:magnesium chelatase family protein
VVAARVARARDIQRERYAAMCLATAMTNAHCSTAIVEDVAQPDSAGLALLRDASDKLGFSARAYHRVLRVARTLADLDGEARVGRIHLAESISYRMSAERMAQAA